MGINITVTDLELLSVSDRIRLADYIDPSRADVLGQDEQPQSQWSPARITQEAMRQNAGAMFAVTDPAQVAPAAPTIPDSRIPQGGHLDARGFPWDSRIHSDARTKNNDGTWRYRRGVKDDVIQTVEAELRGVMGFPSDTVHHTAIPAPPAPPVPPAPAAPTGNDFDDLALYVTPLLAAKTITQAQVSEILRAVGTANNCDLSHLGKLMHRTDLIPDVRTRIEALVAGAV